MKRFRHRILLLVTATVMATAIVAGPTASAALADNPHAGKSGHFKGSAKPCKQGGNPVKCPPFGR